MKRKGKTKKEVLSHNDDIICLKVSQNREIVITGQVGHKPWVFLWDSTTAELNQKIELPGGSRGVTACCISPKARYCAVVDHSDDHHLYIIKFTSNKKSIINKIKTGGNKIMDIEWFEKDDKHTIGIVGVKTAKFLHFSDDDIKSDKL